MEISAAAVRRFVSLNLKRLRAHEKISQLELASISGLTHNFINDIKNCKKGISITTIAKLSSALNVEPYQLFISPETEQNKMNSHIKYLKEAIKKNTDELAESVFEIQTKSGK